MNQLVHCGHIHTITIDPYITFEFADRGQVLWKVYIDGLHITSYANPFGSDHPWVQLGILETSGEPDWYGVACRVLQSIAIWYQYPGEHLDLNRMITCGDILGNDCSVLFASDEYRREVYDAQLKSKRLILKNRGHHYGEDLSLPEGVFYSEVCIWDSHHVNIPGKHEISRLLQCVWLPCVADIVSMLDATTQGLVTHVIRCFTHASPGLKVQQPRDRTSVREIVFASGRQSSCQSAWSVCVERGQLHVKCNEGPTFPVWIAMPYRESNA